KSSLPAGVRIVPTYDRSELIRRAISTLREKLIEESIVVALVCIVFLWHVRSSLVAIITLPVAIILAFIPMWWMNLTSNIMSLSAQEGRLFKPLAFTKTFSMFFAAFLGVTLVPVLMLLLIRGKITPEIKNPVNRFLIWAYQPLANFVLRYRAFTIAVGAVIMLFGAVVP